MTRQELCQALQTPDDTPAEEILASWQRRRSEIGAALALDGHPKPVKMRLRDELRRLESAEAAAAQLRLAAQFDRYLAELAAERSKPAPGRGIMSLCLSKANQLVPQITDSELRFACEKKIAQMAEPAVETPSADSHSNSAAVAAPPKSAVRAAVLELHPLPAEETLRRVCPTIRLIVSPRFTLGRQSGADLVTRFLPETDENQRRTTTISRINTTLFIRGRQIWVQDGQVGDGVPPQPSRNGTVIDDTSIVAPLALNFTKERRFRLGQFGYQVRALHLPSAGAAGASSPDGPSGCIRFRAGESKSEPHGAESGKKLLWARDDILSLWLLSEVTLGSSPAAAVQLASSLPPIAARVRFSGGQFMLTVPEGDSSAVVWQGQPCAGGSVFPLSSDQELAIGNQRFTLRST